MNLKYFGISAFLIPSESIKGRFLLCLCHSQPLLTGIENAIDCKMHLDFREVKMWGEKGPFRIYKTGSHRGLTQLSHFTKNELS